MAFFTRKSKEHVKDINPNLEEFAKTSTESIDTIIDKHSVIDRDTTGYITEPFAAYQDMLYMPLLTNKSERIKQYRNISKYPEVDWCIEEIADDFPHTDEDGHIVKLLISENSKIADKDKQKKILQDEFTQYINLFKFDKDLFTLVKNYIIEGEIAFENIIDPEKPEKGIIALKYLPTEYYETLVDAKTKRPVGIYFDIGSLKLDQQMLVSGTQHASQKHFNSLSSGTGSYSNSNDMIPLIWPQLTYIASNNTNTSNTIHYPVIEKCKNIYHQLSLMHDAAVILRVTRAPERLLFNISTGGMADKVAKSYVKRFVDDFKSKKSVNSDGDITKAYNPRTMLESYFFWKSEESGGTEVSSVGGTATYDQMDDIEYFLIRMFKIFKVPFSRFKQPENTMERDESISYEEYSFFKQIIRIHKVFGIGIKDGFITHLKLRKLWQQYNLKDSDINVVFTPPALYELYQSSKLLQIKSESYDLLADKEGFSKRLTMKKVFGMSDDEIDANFSEDEKEKLRESVIEYYQEKITENGPKEAKPAIAWADATNSDDSEW